MEVFKKCVVRTEYVKRNEMLCTRHKSIGIYHLDLDLKPFHFQAAFLAVILTALMLPGTSTSSHLIQGTSLYDEMI